jgi:hypothetical protein
VVVEVEVVVRGCKEEDEDDGAKANVDDGVKRVTPPAVVVVAAIET